MNNQSEHLRSLRDLLFHASTFMIKIKCNKHTHKKKKSFTFYLSHFNETKKMYKLLKDGNAPIKNSRIHIGNKNFQFASKNLYTWRVWHI